jgi:hypothetical protein
MRTKNVFYLLLVVIVLSACSGRKQLLTFWQPDIKSGETKMTGYHFESKLRWLSSNDSEYLYFDIYCTDPLVQQRLIRSGVTVYLDTAARKQEYVYFKYPLMRVGQAGRSGRQGNYRQQNYSRNPGISKEVIELVNTSPVYWQSGKVWLLEDPLSDSTLFKSSASIDSVNNLKLSVAVPLTALHPAGLDGLDRISVGISLLGQSGMPGMSGQRGGQQSMATGGGGRSGGGGGRGGRGGGGGGRSGGGQMGGGMPGQSMGSSGPISFWYLTTLSKNSSDQTLIQERQ